MGILTFQANIYQGILIVESQYTGKPTHIPGIGGCRNKVGKSKVEISPSGENSGFGKVPISQIKLLFPNPGHRRAGKPHIEESHQ